MNIPLDTRIVKAARTILVTVFLIFQIVPQGYAVDYYKLLKRAPKVIKSTYSSRSEDDKIKLNDKLNDAEIELRGPVRSSQNIKAAVSANTPDASLIYKTPILPEAEALISQEGPVMTISSVQDLADIRNNLAGNYVLQNDIDLNEIGFESIGTNTERFTGVFDGQGHTITGLYINNSSMDYVGLFGSTSNTAVIKDLTIIDANITGHNYVGVIAGYNSGAITGCRLNKAEVHANAYAGAVVGKNGESYERPKSLRDCQAVGIVVRGSNSLGGLAGYNSGWYENPIRSCHVQGEVIGTGEKIGGLVGDNRCGGQIEDSSADCTVIGRDDVGGLIGLDTGFVYRSFALGDVTGVNNVGGFTGVKQENYEDCYARGNVSGVTNVGGLTGYNWGDTYLYRCYATGAVSGTDSVGGLVGGNQPGNFNLWVTDCFSTGAVSGQTYVGGIVGRNLNNRITNSYYNHTPQNPAQATGDGTGLSGCHSIENNVSYFYSSANLPLSSWQSSAWSRVNEGRDFPILASQETTPEISGLEFTQGAPGSAITITGSGFGRWAHSHYNPAVDSDRNGRVDTADYIALKRAVGSNTSTANYNPYVDADYNGRVDREDLLALTGTLGSSRGLNYVEFSPGITAKIVNWTDTEITCIVPYGVSDGSVFVVVPGSRSIGFSFNQSSSQIN